MVQNYSKEKINFKQPEEKDTLHMYRGIRYVQRY